MNTEQLMTAADLAAMFRLSRAEIYRHSTRPVDPLPCYRLGSGRSRRRYRRDEVAAWLARQRDGEIRVELVDVGC